MQILRGFFKLVTLIFVPVVWIFCPVSLRATFSTEGAQINPLHGSSSREEVERDMKFFFPVEHTLAVIKPTAMSEKGQHYLYKDGIVIM